MSPPEDREHLSFTHVWWAQPVPRQDKTLCVEEYKDSGLFGHSETMTVSEVAPRGTAPFLLPSCPVLFPISWHVMAEPELWVCSTFVFMRLNLGTAADPPQGRRPRPLQLMHRSAVARCFCTTRVLVHSFSSVLVTNFGSHELLCVSVAQTTWVGESDVVTL